MGRIFVELRSVVHFLTTASTWFAGTRADHRVLGSNPISRRDADDRRDRQSERRRGENDHGRESRRGARHEGAEAPSSSILIPKPTAVSRSWTTARSIAACTTRSPIRPLRPRSKSSGRPRRFQNLSVAPDEVAPRETRVEVGGGARRALPIEGQDRQLRGSSTHVIIDCPPALGLLTVNALGPRRTCSFRFSRPTSRSKAQTTCSRRSRRSAASESRRSASWRRDHDARQAHGAGPGHTETDPEGVWREGLPAR